jgi:transcriptional regulator with XRE-family HTH domain
VNKPTKLPEIRKQAFIKAREALGLTTKELSIKACLSNRQIEQLENGEMSSFYSVQIKYTAAKKVAILLNLEEKEAFDFGDQAPAVRETILVEETLPVAEVKKTTSTTAEAIKVEPPKVTAPIQEAKPDLALEVQDIVVEQAINKKSAPSSQRKWLLLLSVAAALVFSIVNLRPLFFPEPPKEELVLIAPVPLESPAVVPPVADEKAGDPVPAAVPVATVAVAPSSDCPAVDPSPLSYKPDAPKKGGDMVYLQSKSAQIVCVIDALGKLQNKQLEPGVGVSVYGKSPLKVLTADLNQVDLYFQGAKVRLVNQNGKTIVLEAAELAQAQPQLQPPPQPQPLNSNDSQLR